MRKLIAVLLAISVASCVFRRVDVQQVDTRAPVVVSSPVKAHLNDGATVVYPNGVTVTSDALVGRGTKYGLNSGDAIVQRVALSDVLGMETFRTKVKVAPTLLVSTLATIGTFAGSIVLAVAIFGSCPTVYSGDGTVEEAELFSSSIAPLFEGRDLDRLKARADATGAVRLHIRNEAMETHYLNHLQLVEVRHRPGELVVPDAQGTPVVIGAVSPPASVRARDGRDLQALVSAADNDFYVTPADALAGPDLDDWIDLVVPVEESATSAALVFRMRNSLLSTTLLYDVMLGPAGAAALDWLGEGLGRISQAVELGRWHQRRAGLHVQVWQDGAYREVARVPDSGPISWHDVAAVVPVPPGERSLRVRLSFLADHWRIDQLGVSFAVQPAVSRGVPLADVSDADGKAEGAALEHMRAPDETYLQTNPGQTFVARFDAGPEPSDGARTFLLASQGYYVEWVRGSWLRSATSAEPFLPTDAAVQRAMRRWAATRDTFEHKFLTARVPTP